ncbi:hypothetical protein DQ04_04431090 [Trypanosoma grayi]|uniref:hypothetical protein n=1 Tax=Trypanosoma grayi TaxID=71804 RepID=UPI0004F3F76A|nr:hypothetical protein DQ04_04431090 [Trypanosoma grayi]KEG09931.1 hypothetical protein DQ04_04431090 [Trypanosoma grayi]
MGFELQPQRRRAVLQSSAQEEARQSDSSIAAQRQLFLELRRRRQYKRLMQCVMNWRSKGLIPERRGAGAHVDNASSASGSGGEVLFNAEEALRGLIFNSTGNQWEKALRECPEFFAITLREPTAALQFLRKTSVDTLTRYVLWLLQGGCTASPLRSPASPHEQGVAWETVASLCFALRPHMMQTTKVVKTDLLQAVLRALRTEAAALGAKSGTQRGVKSGGATLMNDTHCQAMRSVVECLCAPLTRHHEAQVRFVGLPLFAEVGVALCDCGVTIPSALAQCVFLCLGNNQQCPWSELPLPPPPAASGQSTALERETLITMLNAAPSERWVSALRLLQVCAERHNFDVTADHLRTVLSGMQSISINRTWQVALHVAQSIMTQHDVFPDEPSVEKMLLNLHAASWERTFEVLQLYDQNHISPPPLILRDLHVVAIKHCSWDVVLRVMQRIEDVGPRQAGFMNHLYCLRAYGCAGKCEGATDLFRGLKDVKGAFSGRSAYNEVAVAVPLLGMMEQQHWECAVRFVRAIFQQCGTELTKEGAEVALAAELLALAHIGDTIRVAAFLNRHSGDSSGLINAGDNEADYDEGTAPDAHGRRVEEVTVPPSVTELRALVMRAAQLQTLLGMEHLNAPIRLVLDLLAVEPQRRRITSERDAELIGLSRRGGAARPPLYLPPQHVQRQHEWLATTLGKMVRHDEQRFGAAAQQAVAEAMTHVGAGPAYLKAALL